MQSVIQLLKISLFSCAVWLLFLFRHFFNCWTNDNSIIIEISGFLHPTNKFFHVFSVQCFTIYLSRRLFFTTNNKYKNEARGKEHEAKRFYLRRSWKRFCDFALLLFLLCVFTFYFREEHIFVIYGKVSLRIKSIKKTFKLI